MATTDVRPLAVTASETELRPAYCLLVAPASIAIGVLALTRLDGVTVVDGVRLALVVLWAGAGVLVGLRRRTDRQTPIALAASGLAALGMLADATDHAALARVVLGLLPVVGLHLLGSLPDGRLPTRNHRIGVGVAYGAGALGVVLPHDDSGPALWPSVLLWLIAVGVGLRMAYPRYQAGTVTDRRRMQWIGWSIVVIGELMLAIVAALRLMTDWPAHSPVVALATTALLPLALAAGTHMKMIAHVDRLLTHTVAAAGLTALVIVAYVAVVVALGRSMRDGERSLLLLSMVAAVLAAVIYLPMRKRLADLANQMVYGERVAPDEALRTWGSRLTRAIPLDELLLQLTESLRKSMSLVSAEIFTGTGGRYELAAGVPHRTAPILEVGEKERAIVARAGVSGGTWLDVWLPQLGGAHSAQTRVAPIAHGGELLGMIVLVRRSDGSQFSDDDDRVVTELARQVGLALHNVQLDSALQASLEELQRANTDLQQSRLRIVSAGDAERRKLERNLHDGAQQHLVAMAVKLRMVEELVEDDPNEAMKVIAELRDNLKDAIAELRALAHGIFPPLLMSGGLAEALPAAAGRAALPTTVETTGIGRYTPEIESTVYFCCLEAMQNAGKHAGDDAEIAITVEEHDGSLTFTVTDDGVGFEPGARAVNGHGFVNMTDRLGTVRGRLTATSALGRGTTIRGDIPLP